jgi:hypothetical protein
MKGRALLVVLAFAAAARADEPSESTREAIEEARVYFEAGRQAYEGGEYQTAIRSFEHAFEKVPRPEIAFSLAQAYRKQFIVDEDPTKLRRAVELYRRYLDEVPAGGRREDAVQNLGELQPQLARVTSAAAPAPAPPPARTQLMVTAQVAGAHVAIDSDVLAAAPLTKDVTPGRHAVHVEAPGYVSAELVGLAVEGRLVVVEAPLRERPALLAVDAGDAEVTLDGRPIDGHGGAVAASAGKHVVAATARGHEPWVREVTLERGALSHLQPDLPPTGQRRAATWVLAGSAAVLVGAAVTTGVALVAQSDAQDLLARQGSTGWSAADLAAYDDARGRRDRFVTAAAVLYAVAAAGGVAGAVLYVADSPRVEHAAAPAAARVSLVPQASASVVGAALIGRF